MKQRMRILPHEIPRDAFGPEYLVEVSDASVGMRGFLVIDNTALGPGKGGIRMTPGVTLKEIFRLARTMTWKNALAGIPFGGAKAGIIWHGGDDALKKRYIQSFARALKPFLPKTYIAGPDVQTGEREMQWFVEAADDWHAATGKPAGLCMKLFGEKGEKCGLPHEYGSTGFGVAEATRIAARLAGVVLQGATVAIHGFGNVGTFTYRFLTAMGAKVILVGERSCALFSRDGFDNTQMETLISRKESLKRYRGAKIIAPHEFWKIPVDILIPASVTDVINDSNKRFVKARVIVEAANIPMQGSIESEFVKKGVVVVPDFVANAGGVISSYAEYRGYNPKQMFQLIARKIRAATERVLEKSVSQKKNPRMVAQGIAERMVKTAMRLRRSSFL